MADREPSFSELKKLFEAHGCEVTINRRQFITVTRGTGADHRYWKQHAHKGKRDSFDRYVLQAARRRLGFNTMPDDEFYSPLG